MSKIYLASSWRNQHLDGIVGMLTFAGHEVLDFREPGCSFNWSDLDPQWEEWDTESYLKALENPRAMLGFKSDLDKILAAEWVILVPPCGLSAGIEFGYAVGMGRKTMVLAHYIERPDLMIKMSRVVVKSDAEMLEMLDGTLHAFT